MEIVDYKTQLKKFYKPASNNIEWVDVPSMNFIMIDGQGDPTSSPEYANAVEVLFTIALAVKLIVTTQRDIADIGFTPTRAC